MTQSQMYIQLNLQLFAGEKTEPATPKRRQDARNKGQVAKSQELPSALILLSSFVIFYSFSDFFYRHITELFAGSFQDFLLLELTFPNMQMIFLKCIYHGFIIMAPILVSTVIIGIFANLVQFGFLFSGQSLMPAFSKINPLTGIARMFSLRSLVEFLKTLVKLLVVGIVIYLTISAEQQNLLGLSQLQAAGIFSYLGMLCFDIGIKVGIIMLVLAVFDYLYQKYELEKELKMSKDEIKQEYKNTEGDPMVKAKIREIQRRMAMKRMMQEVPKADVIITNPTHYAVAVKYDAGSMSSPVVIAKGVDFVALKIREVAAQNGIVLMENKPLAQALYKQVEIGDSIPQDLFKAVAEVLAYVYRLKKKTN